MELFPTFAAMKNTIFTLLFLVLPVLGWAQFDDFSKLEYTEEEIIDALRYNVHGCTSEMKVVLTRHSTNGGVLIVNFKDYDDESLEKISIKIGPKYHYKTIPLNKHLIILVGDEHHVSTKKNWTKTIVITYSNFKLYEFGDDITSKPQNYDAREDADFMMSLKQSNYDYYESDNLITLRYRDHLYMVDLDKGFSTKVDLSIRNTKDNYKALRIIPTKSTKAIHVFARSVNNKFVILKLGKNGDIQKVTTIEDDVLSKSLYLSSMGFYEEDDNYFFCGVSKNSMGGADGLRTYSIVNGVLSMKTYGFTDKEQRSLKEDVSGLRVRTNEGGFCKVLMAKGKTYIVVTYLKSAPTGGSQPYEVVTNINALEIVDNVIINSLKISFPDIQGRLFDEYTLLFNDDANQIVGINSNRAGITQVVFDFDNKTGKSLNIFDGLTWSHNIISSNQVFIFGLFKDGQPYQMQMNKKKDKGSYYATGLLEF